MESMMKRMREQMNALLNRFGSGNGTSITDVEDLPGFAFPSIPELDLGKGNTTSVTKVIDGHKVVINETRYGKEDEHGGAFFKVRVIEVKPEKPDVEVDTVAAPRDVESVENSQENEIPKKAETEAPYGNLESFDDIDYTIRPKTFPTFNRWANQEDFDEDNRIDGPLASPMKPYDLSRDTYVNKLLAHKGHRRNPDAEFVDTIQKGHDLSHDIMVNKLMADQAVLPDPESEFIPRNTRLFEKYINPR
ncbi:hypothetical protein HHI36_010667 [Cryptolaemus montrouzieri]|uniref:Uncharacterized protein n=1 Tax=Cryptolaemus montrouzieri TaxID=559131 RepID=A0ABD2MJE8_9CUCU